MHGCRSGVSALVTQSEERVSLIAYQIAVTRMTEVALEIACGGVPGSSNRQRFGAHFGEAKESMTSESGLPEGSGLPAGKNIVNLTESSCPRPSTFMEATNLAMSDRLGNLLP